MNNGQVKMYRTFQLNMKYVYQNNVFICIVISTLMLAWGRGTHLIRHVMYKLMCRSIMGDFFGGEKII